MLHRVFTGLAALVGAAVFAQFPTFYGDYLQRLGGRLDQARAQVERLEMAARAEDMELGEFVAVFLESERSPVRRLGRVMQTQIAERARLETAAAALREAPAVARPWRFARHVEGGLARATLADFAPALPLDPGGLVYAALGLFAGLGLADAGRRGGRALLHKRQAA